MTVYNGAEFLRETIDSILAQDYKDFTFLIVDNASTDTSREIIKSYNDPRIQLEALPENIGQIPALNKGLSLIHTSYIARMDADDIALPHRFSRQVEFMDANPQVAVCGSYALAFNTDTRKTEPWHHPVSNDDIAVRLLFECCLVHPAVIMRKEFLDKHLLKYHEQIGHSEDWLLWQQVARYGKLYNIPEILLRYRVHGKSESRRILDRQLKAAQTLDDDSLSPLGLQDHPLRKIHRDVAFETFNTENREEQFLHDVVEWFETLQKANGQHSVYHPEALDRFLKQRLFVVLTNNTRHRKWVRKYFFKNRLYRHIKLSWSIKFVLKLFISIFKPAPTPRGTP